jgi:hypothetical protein
MIIEMLLLLLSFFSPIMCLARVFHFVMCGAAGIQNNETNQQQSNYLFHISEITPLKEMNKRQEMRSKTGNVLFMKDKVGFS